MSNVKLPKQVQMQADAAAAIEQSLQAAPQAPVVSDVTQLVAPAAPAPIENPPQPPVAAEARTAQKDDFEHKYRVLQGMFNKTNEQLRDATTRLEQVTAQLNTKPEQPPEPAPKPAVDPRDVETFGAAMIAMVQRYAESTFQALANQFGTKLAEVETRLAAIGQALNGVSQQTTLSLEQTFWSELEKLVPDFAQVNADAQFIAWLEDADPVYGVPRQAALASAQKALDAQRVAAVFKAFKATRPAVASPPPNPLANQIAPSAASSASVAPAHAPAAPVTQQAIRQFYDDVRRGKYVGREAEMGRIEAAINQAAAEGRIM